MDDGSNPTLVWFRQDLRLADNPALQHAVSQGSILPIYIFDDVNAGQWTPGAASRAWLHHSLSRLNHSLNGELRCFRGDPGPILDRLIRQHGIGRIVWNRCYEPWQIERDRRIKARLRDRGVECSSFNASLLWEPWTIAKKDGTPYRVFTPYWKQGCLGAGEPAAALAAPADIDFYAATETADVCALGLLPDHPWHEAMLSHWPIGEDDAAQRLAEFCEQDIDGYADARDRPDLEATSRLSPHLHFGELSPRQAWHAARHAQLTSRAGGADAFLRELGWREFSYHLLYHFPDLPERNFNPQFDDFEWQPDEDMLERWKKGCTGYPLVDAGMRELWQTGYMHNRVRMVVASFLIKNQLQHWHEGERWFWDCLVDADLASNSASWQWCAGSGADAAPYFRIFNPVTQSEKFDPDGIYLARYCPELAGLPAPHRHQPWKTSGQPGPHSGFRYGQDYPRTVVDLKQTRERALTRYQAMRQKRS